MKLIGLLKVYVLDNYKMLRELDSYQLTFNDLNINLPEIDIISYKLTENGHL